MTAYSNRLDLANKLVKTMQRLRRAEEQAAGTRVSVRSTGRSDRRWRVRDRLGEGDVRALVAGFVVDGTPKWKLAQQYGVSESSVKRLVRKHRLTEDSEPPRVWWRL